ncbi:transposase [Aequorivita marina]|uniref:transposase n=1 Tax=Aequorivita marina TaxID=3073654 RepID=UPI0028755480|nr:transposase [Aequorivita sp. S2608]MDS1297231.1 transposase [Aequorivita sp. S2608]
MSWVRIWVHLVFSTKNRKAFLATLDIREQMFLHIAENAKKKDIWMDCVGGYSNHVHCLISLGKNQCISQVGQLIKGESSNWLNKQNLIKSHFQWQDDYWAVSVSESHLDALRKYISSQEMHHKKKTFSEEIDLFMKKYNWTVIKG